LNDVLPILALNLAISALLFFILWRVAVRINDPSFIDSWWALGVVVLAWSTFLQAPEPGAHALALLSLATAWGLRLGLYLLWRWQSHGHDRRYEKLAQRAKEKHGMSFARFALLWVFAPQMLLQFIMALPAQLGQIAPPERFGELALAGLLLSALGIIYEAVADAQLARFKADPANAGKVMDQGVWRYSRHPNYFGELCAWWGMYLIACETPYGAWSLPGPLLLTFLLTRISGAPTTEPHLTKTRPDYDAYKRRTSSFIPLPPKAS
jgi:steroid 5-alpha reductase family enzyme